MTHLYSYFTEEENILRKRHTAQVEDMIDDTYPTSDPTPLLRSLTANRSNNARTPLMREMEMSDVAENDSAGLVENEASGGVNDQQMGSNSASYSRLQDDVNGELAKRKYLYLSLIILGQVLTLFPT